MKHMNIIATARGTNYRLQALAVGERSQGMSLYERAIEEYTLALVSSPNNQVFFFF